MPRRLGIMGGTFDPIHHGHLVAAEEARYGLTLDEVVFVPAGRPWQKSEDVTPAELRLQMVKLATDDNAGLEVSRMEVERTGPTYTIDTVRQFRTCADPDADLFFITGADAILEILTWKDPGEAMDIATFVAVSRPGYDLSRLDRLGRAVRERVVVLEIPALAISSTDIRHRVAAGRPIRYLVPDVVVRFIDEHRLYRPA